MAAPPGGDENGIKIILCGDISVGKSNVMLRYTTGDEYRPVSQATLGAGFSSKIVEIDGQRRKVLVWDTAGQEKFRSITSLYYRGAHAALLVYDVTKIDTFNNIDRWFTDVIRTCGNPNIVLTLIGNKIDLVDRPGLGVCREVATDLAKTYARNHGMNFFETSAYDDISVTEAFDATIRAAVTYLPAPSVVPPLRLDRMQSQRATKAYLTPEALALATPRDAPARKKSGCCSS